MSKYIKIYVHSLNPDPLNFEICKYEFSLPSNICRILLIVVVIKQLIIYENVPNTIFFAYAIYRLSWVGHVDEEFSKKEVSKDGISTVRL